MKTETDRATPLVLEADASILDATMRLRGDRYGFGIVEDAEGRYLGSVSDFDIRHAVLRRCSLSSPVREIMSQRGPVARAGDSDAQVREILESRRVRAVPMLDEEGRVAGIRTLDEFPGAAPAAPIAVIMAGGRGQRLRPLTDKVPKPLLRVGSSSIIERIIKHLGAAGVADVHLAVNYKAEIFHERLGKGEALGVNLHYIHEQTELGTAGALSLIETAPDGPIIVTNGDLVSTVDFGRLVDFHRRHGGAVTVGGVDYVSHVPYGILDIVNHHLLSIQEKPERRELCNAGIYVIEPHVLGYLTPGAHMNMPDLIADVLADGASVNVFPIYEKWFDIGSPAEFERILIQFATGEES